MKSLPHGAAVHVGPLLMALDLKEEKRVVKRYVPGRKHNIWCWFGVCVFFFQVLLGKTLPDELCLVLVQTNHRSTVHFLDCFSPKDY